MTTRRHADLRRSRIHALLAGLSLLGAAGCDDGAGTGGQGGDGSTSASTSSGTSTSTSASTSPTSSSASSGTGGAAETSWAIDAADGEGSRVVTTESGDPVFVGSTAHDTDFGLGSKKKGGYVLRTDRAGKPVWNRSFGSNGQVLLRAADARGGLIVVGGFYNDAITFDDGTPALPAPNGGGAFLVGLDEDGKILFTRTFTTAAPSTVAPTLSDVSINGNGKIAVLGTFAGDIDFGAGPTTCDPATKRLLYYSTSNAYLTTRVAPLPSLQALATTTGDETYIVGRFDGTVQLGSKTLTSSGGSDVVIVHLDAQLDIADVRTFGSPLDDVATDVAVRPTGIAIVGGNDGSIDFGLGAVAQGLFYVEASGSGDATASRRFATVTAGQALPSSLAIDPAGGFAVTGFTFDGLDLGTGKLQPASYDAFFAAYDASGAPTKAFILGSNDLDAGPSLGGLAMTSADVFLAGRLLTSATVDGIAVSVVDPGRILHARLLR